MDFCFENADIIGKKFRLHSVVGHGYVSVNVTLQYFSVFYDLLLMLQSQFTLDYLLHILYSHFYR